MNGAGIHPGLFSGRIAGGFAATALDRDDPSALVGYDRALRASPFLDPLLFWMIERVRSWGDGLLNAVGEELGPDAALRVLERVSNDRVAAFAPSVEGRTMEEKLGVLTGWYFEGDPHMDFASAGDDYVLIERNCPYYNTAMHRPALCSVTVNALTRLLGVRVARQETFQNGDGRCVFHVYAQQPVTDPRFALET